MRGTVRLDGTSCSLLHLGWGNYYHWMLQALPRLHAAIRTHGEANIDRFLVGAPQPFQSESYERLGIDATKLLQARDEDCVYECAVLIAGSMPQQTPTPRWAIDWLRSTFAIAPPVNPTRRIYVERGSARRRRVVNEDEVLTTLSGHGFESVTMDHMTIGEQAAIFASAEIIVAVHGAALTNVVFATPGARLIELLPANHAHAFFWHLAQRVEVAYDVLVGSEPTIGFRHAASLSDADVIVDVRALDELLARAST
jgi:capsular polysaccharide biosynthesis protein